MADVRKVLVLDDESLVCFMVSTSLKRAGFSVTSAQTIEDAMKHIKNERFHVIVSDVSMGEMDGFMFRSLVRAVDSRIPIVYFTAMLNDANNTFMMRVSEDIYSYYVPKSDSLNALVEKVRQIVDSYTAEFDINKMSESMTRGLKLAGLVQKAMLPPWVCITPRYTYTNSFTPLYEVSGDFYEWIPISDGTAIFIGGDISGHGTSASLAQTAVQSFVKQFATLDDRHARRVYDIARHIHEFILANMKDVVYLVATIIYFDFRLNEALFLNCGAPDALCYSRKTGKIRDINPDRLGALPLGLMEDAVYNEQDVVPLLFDPEEVFVLMSDGVYDLSRDPAGNDIVPAQLLREIVSRAVAQTTTTTPFMAIPHRIMSTLESLDYTQKHDDISFFVVGPNIVPPEDLLQEVTMRPAEIDAVCHRAGLWANVRFGDVAGVKVDLLLNEYLMNVCRYGLDDFGRQHERAVVLLQEAAEGFTVTVWDRGAPWQSLANVSEGEADRKLDAQNDTLASGGRGCPIIRKVADSIRVERFTGMNKTVFFLKERKEAATDETAEAKEEKR
jgi:serine phosphatase RsbU (regulator of sigma subunit)/anti-sigma regulatory factor (Ser/Thr protein kinase)